MPVKKKITKEVRESERECCPDRRGDHGLFWPIALILVGLVWLARNMGWLDHDVPWFPLLLIGFGVYLIVRHTTRQGEKKETP
jgi:fatty acid desaturase